MLEYNLTYLWLDIQNLQLSTFWRRHSPLGQLLLFQENLQIHGDSLKAQHIISVGWDLNLELWWLRHVFGLCALARVLVQLDTEFET